MVPRNTADASPAPLVFRAAEAPDIPAMTVLINSAYRGESSTRGWTTETHLLEGRRIDEAGLARELAAPDTLFLLCFRDDTLIGSAQVRRTAEGVGYLGMFVIRPGLQGLGLGRRLLQEAETTARRLWGVARMTMAVIGLRSELIAYYQRRGYRLTGERLPLPLEDGLSAALVEGIDLAMMEKSLPPSP